MSESLADLFSFIIMRIGNTIYLDHQATTPVDEKVFLKMAPYFCSEFGNPHSSDHVLGWNSAAVVDEARSNIARLIGCDHDEIVFTSGATESNNLALLGFASQKHNQNRTRILIGATEHKSILEVGRILGDQHGFNIELISVDRQGLIETDKLKNMMDDRVLLVSAIAVNNEIGTIQNLDEIASICHHFGAVFHSDCAQAPSAFSLQNHANIVDLLSLSAHKMYGPKGIGVLYLRRELADQMNPLIHGGDQQSGLRSGTIPVPLCVGMGEAANLMLNDESNAERELVRNLRNKLVDRLLKLPWEVKLNGPDFEHRHPGNANLTFYGFSAQDVLGVLQPHLAASTGSACTTGIPEASHVLSAIGLTRSESNSSIRFGIGRLTTERDVDDSVELIDQSLFRLYQSHSSGK